MQPQLYVTNRKEWRSWLKKNHNKGKLIWLVYYKKHTGRPRIPYDDAVEEALCYGWIDSTVKRIDDEIFIQKFTPRKKRSVWSDLNKQRVKKLIKLGKMAKPGMEKVIAAKENGDWDKVPKAQTFEYDMPAELETLLSSNKKAASNFSKLSPSNQKRYIAWIASAKKIETRERRAAEAFELIKSNQELGMK
jgi:uncharacterized protein YdeI (YjbR/CyaY-like superfamily)